MSYTLSSVLPRITELQSELISVTEALATVTENVPLVQNSRSYVNIHASLTLLSFEAILATATDKTSIASASMAAEVAESIVSSLYEDENLYGMHPSKAGNTVMAVMMGLFFAIHSALGYFYKSWWFGISFFCGCGLEMAGYIGRSISASDPIAINPFLVQIICLTIAPVFIMAGIYYLLAQLITIYGTKFGLLSPMLYAYIFMTCDVISLVLQAVGGGMAATSLSLYKSADQGTHVMVGGLSFQVFSMSIFIFLFSHFLYKIKYHNWKKHEEMNPLFNPEYTELRKRKIFKLFPIIISFSVLFVYIRSIYRVIELAQGWSGYLITHEVYFMTLDALMMGLTCLIFILFHPGTAYGRANRVFINHSIRKNKNSKEQPEERKTEEHEEEDDETQRYDEASTQDKDQYRESI